MGKFQLKLIISSLLLAAILTVSGGWQGLLSNHAVAQSVDLRPTFDPDAPPGFRPPPGYYLELPGDNRPQGPWLQTILDTERAKSNVVGMGVAVANLRGDRLVRVSGHPTSESTDSLSTADRWHIGSNTKALTALLYGKLVQQDLASWDATLPELFPDLASNMHPGWKSITIKDLFAHRSGLTDINGVWLMARHADKRPMNEQRYETVQTFLRMPPSPTVGQYQYTNINYIVAGSAIEQILSRQSGSPVTWEDAMRDYIFAAVPGIDAETAFGFGPPQTRIEGHRSTRNGPPQPVGKAIFGGDNPAAMGPAGTMNASLLGHANLALEFIDNDSTLVPWRLRETLFAPYPDDQATYAMGWGVTRHERFGLMYEHNGSNTMWWSHISIVPSLGTVIVINANEATTEAHRAVFAIRDQALEAILVARYGEAPPSPGRRR